jgi:hypothetical protein
MMTQYVAQETFVAQPYYGLVPPGAPIAQRPPRMFVRGQTILADQMSMGGTPILVSNDFYIVDPTKVVVSLNPIVMTQSRADVGMLDGEGVYGRTTTTPPAPIDYSKVQLPGEMKSDEKGLFSTENLVKVIIFMVLIFIFLKYVLPLIKQSFNKTA